MKKILIEVSAGELIDKLTILEIKLEKISSPTSLKEIDKYLMTYSDDIKSIIKETIKKVKSEKQIENLQKLQEQIQDITIN